MEQPEPTRDDIRIATLRAEICLHYPVGGKRCKALVKLNPHNLTAKCHKAGGCVSLVKGGCPRGRW